MNGRLRHRHTATAAAERKPDAPAALAAYDSVILALGTAKALKRRAAGTAALILLANLRSGTGPEGLGFARFTDSVRNELGEKLLSNAEAAAFRSAESAEADRVLAALSGVESAAVFPAMRFGGWASSLAAGRDDGGRAGRLLTVLASTQSRLLALGTEPEGMEESPLGLDEDELHEIGLMLESALLARGSLLASAGLQAPPAPDGSDPGWLELAGFTTRGPLGEDRLAEITERLNPLLGGCLWYRLCRGVRLLEAGDPAAASQYFAAGADAGLYIDEGMPLSSAFAAGLLLTADMAEENAPAGGGGEGQGAVRRSAAEISRLLYTLERSLVPQERGLASLLFALRGDAVRACDIMRNAGEPSGTVHGELLAFLGITPEPSDFVLRGRKAEEGGVLEWMRRAEELSSEFCMKEALEWAEKAAAAGFAPAKMAALTLRRTMGIECGLETGNTLAAELERGTIADISVLGPLASECPGGIVPDGLARFYHGIAAAEAAAWLAFDDADRARSLAEAALAENPGSSDLRELKFSMILNTAPFDEAEELLAGLQAEGFRVPRMLLFSFRGAQGLPADDIVEEGARCGEPMSLVFKAKRMLAEIPSAAARRKALEMLGRAADEGCTVAMEILAQAVEDRDTCEALLRTAMDRGSLSAAAELAKSLIFHDDADDASKAAGLQILEKALSAPHEAPGHDRCRALYAALLLSGGLVTQDTERGMAMLESAGECDLAAEVRAAYGPLAPERLQEEINRGNPEAMVRAAEILSEGDDSDLETVLRLLAGAAELGSMHARYLLADIMLRNAGREDEFLKHLGAMHDCVVAGSTEAVDTAALLCRMGRWPYPEEERQDIFRRLGEQADSGDVEAMYELGMMHAEGVCTPQDPVKAAVLLSRAAEEGSVPAAFEMAVRLSGDRSPEGQQAFRRMLAKGAAGGNAECMFAMGRMLVDGDGFEEDAEAGAEYLLRAAGEEHPAAMLNAAIVLWMGLGAGRDRKRALELMEKSAAAGHPDAMLWLGRHYGGGVFAPRDADKAEAYLRAALAAGREAAQDDLNALGLR